MHKPPASLAASPLCGNRLLLLWRFIEVRPVRQVCRTGTGPAAGPIAKGRPIPLLKGLEKTHLVHQLHTKRTLPAPVLMMHELHHSRLVGIQGMKLRCLQGLLPLLRLRIALQSLQSGNTLAIRRLRVINSWESPVRTGSLTLTSHPFHLHIRLPMMGTTPTGRYLPQPRTLHLLVEPTVHTPQVQTPEIGQLPHQPATPITRQHCQPHPSKSINRAWAGQNSPRQTGFFVFFG
jgi:hypothetical protein